MPLISVVIACCDVAPWLKKCVRSFTDQSFLDFDLTLFVEESKDDTAEIAKRLAAQDARIQCVFSPRSGSASASRNYAIHQAKGDYIWMFDGDDWAGEDSLQAFADAIKRYNQPDVILARRITWRESAPDTFLRIGELIPPGMANSLYHGLDYCLKTTCLEASFHPALTPICFKRQSCLALNFDVPYGRRHQDSGWLYRFLLNVNTTLVIDKDTCHYLKRPGSITTKQSPKSCYDVADNCYDCLSYYASLPRADPRRSLLARHFIRVLFHYHPIGISFSGGAFDAVQNAHDVKNAWKNNLFKDQVALNACRSIFATARWTQKLEWRIMQVAQLPGCFHLMRFLLARILWPLKMKISKKGMQ